MRVVCPGCNVAMTVNASLHGSRISCDRCGASGLVGSSEWSTPVIRRADDADALTVNSMARKHASPPPESRPVAFVCGCGYHADLPERYRRRVGRCPACGQWAMAGDATVGAAMAVQAVRDVAAAVARQEALDSERRLFPRIPMQALHAHLPAAGTVARVRDLSISGLALGLSPLRIATADTVTLNLSEGEAPVLTRVTTRLVRLGRDAAGLAFVGLNMGQRRELRSYLTRSAQRRNVASFSPEQASSFQKGIEIAVA